MFDTAGLSTHRAVTERSLPAWLAVAVQRFLTGPVETARPGGALAAVRAGESLTTLTLTRGHTDPALQLALPLTLGLVTEHPGPPGLAPTLEPLAAVAVQTAGEGDTVPAPGPRVAQVTLTLARGQTVAVLGVALGATDRHLAEVSYPALQALDLALSGAHVPGLLPQPAGTAGLLLPAPALARCRAGHSGHHQEEEEEEEEELWDLQEQHGGAD